MLVCTPPSDKGDSSPPALQDDNTDDKVPEPPLSESEELSVCLEDRVEDVGEPAIKLDLKKTRLTPEQQKVLHAANDNYYQKNP